MNSIAQVPYNMQNNEKDDAEPYVYYGCADNFFTVHPKANDANSYDVAHMLLTQALATAKLLINNGESIDGFRFRHDIIINAISGMETQIEMAIKALEHQLLEPAQ